MCANADISEQRYVRAEEKATRWVQKFIVLRDALQEIRNLKENVECRVCGRSESDLCCAQEIAGEALGQVGP